jgi:hypothetical protein
MTEYKIMDDDEKPASLKERLNNIEQSLSEGKKKEKKFKFKIPFKGKLSKQNIKKGFVTVQILHENGSVDFIKTKIDNGTISVEGCPRISTADYTIFYKGKPLIILPAWSLIPFSPVDNYEQTVKDKLTTAGRRLIIERMKLDAIKAKKGMGFGLIGWIVLGAAVIGVGYFLIKGGKIF